MSIPIDRDCPASRKPCLMIGYVIYLMSPLASGKTKYYPQNAVD